MSSWIYSSGLGMFFADRTLNSNIVPNNLYSSNNCIGINTSNPIYTLDVNGNIHTTSNIYVYDSNTYISYASNANYIGPVLEGVYGGALQANNIVQLFWNTSGVNINQLYAPSANVGSLTVSNLNISGSLPWKMSSWSMYGTPSTLIGISPYIISQGYYDSHSDVNGGSILPIGISGFNNNSNTSNCYIEYTGYFSNNSSVSVAPGHTITPTTSIFEFYYTLNSATSGTVITAYNTLGNPATMSITCYNGEAGGFSTGLSDTFYFPSAYIGNNQNRLFLNIQIQDAATQSAGFVLNSGTAYFF